MKSVAIVSINNSLSKTVAKKLANQLNCKFIDLEKEFEQILLLNIRTPLFNNAILEQKEHQLIKYSAEQENVVISLNNDMFLSNGNYNLLKNLQIVLIEQDFDDKISKNLQSLIKKYANISIREKDIDKLITFLKG